MLGIRCCRLGFFIFCALGMHLSATQAVLADDLCAFIAAVGPRGIAQYTIQSGDWDVNGDGSDETVALNTDLGTMHAEHFDIVDLRGIRHSLEMPFFGRGGGYAARWLRRGKQAYLLTFASENARYILGAFKVAEDYKLMQVCWFDNVERRTFFALREGDKAVCTAADASPPEPINSPRDVRRARVDFDNDGVIDELVLRYIDDTGGRGCQYSTFEFEHSVGSRAGRRKAELLAAVQEYGDSYSRIGSRCPATWLSWFSSGGKTYLRAQPALQHFQAEADYADRVDGIINGVPRRVCDAHYGITWKVVAPPH